MNYLVSRLAIVSVAGLVLASCVDQQKAVALAFDKTCSAEPIVYEAFTRIAANTEQISEKVKLRAAQVHAGALRLCTDRPTDIVAALVTLSAAYTEIVAINAQAQKVKVAADIEAHLLEY